MSAPPASVASTSSNTSNTTTNTSTTVSKSEEESFFEQPATLLQEKNKMSKDSILALYGTPSNQQSAMFGIPGTVIILNTLIRSKYWQTFIYEMLLSYVLGGMYAQQSTVQYKQVPNVAPFGQQSSFPNQQSSLTQLNQLPAQMSVATNQLPINQNQMAVNPNTLGPVAPNSLGNCLHVGQINQMNGVPNSAIAMQSPMVNNFIHRTMEIFHLFVSILIVTCIVR